MSFSTPFILRPIGTALLAAGLFLLGGAAYFHLPVASLPTVDFPTLRVQASRPGADPETMAATIAAPLERRLGEIAGVTELTSVSSQGSTRISIQFDLSRSIDGAARDVQAALNAAAADLPGDLPQVPTFRKYNPSASPVLILAMTSKNLAPSALYDSADTVVAQRISQVDGVAEVDVSGAEQPAIRVRVNPRLLASMGLSLEEVRSAIEAANTVAPVGSVEGDKQEITLDTNDQLREPEDYGAIVLKTSEGNVVRLSSVASIAHGTRDTRSAAMFDREPAVLLIIRKQPDANVIETVDRVKDMIPDLRRWIPAGIDITVLSDRTATIRSSVKDMQITLLLSIALVMLVVFLFLRRGTPTVAAGITVPLSLAGTCAAMWALGYSINNLTLMSFAIAVGFVVDDAIVMIENVYRKLEAGMTPIAAALAGARQIGFTVLSISVSLIAAFIPILFMSGIVGRLLREFSVTLAVAIAVSLVVSLSITPMICAHFLKSAPDARATRFDRIVEGVLGWLVNGYARTLTIALRHQAVMLFTLICVVLLTVHLYIQTPKGFFPEDDTGLIITSTKAAGDISFDAMVKLQAQALDTILSDPAVQHVGSSVGASGRNGSINRGRMFVNLKPLNERGGVNTRRVINRMRDALANIYGLEVRMFPSRDIRVGARQGDSEYQFTLWDPDIDELQAWAPKVLERMKRLPGLVDVSNDRDEGGLQLDVKINRDAAARLGVQISDIDSALNDAFSQRQISTIYAQRNQYRVILEIDPRLQRDPSDLQHVHVPSRKRHAGALDERHPAGEGHRPAGDQSSRTVPRHHHVLQSCTGDHARRRNRRYRSGHGGVAYPAGVARRVRRRCARLCRKRLAAASTHLGGAARRLHRARRPLRKPRASPDHHLDAAVGGPRRAARLAHGRHGAVGDGAARRHPADRHREEERHHDGRLRARRRARARPAARTGDLRGVHRTLPPHPHDHDGGAARRAPAGARRGTGRRHPAPPRRDDHRRIARVADTDAVHHAGHLPAARPAAPPPRGRRALRRGAVGRGRRGGTRQLNG